MNYREMLRRNGVQVSNLFSIGDIRIYIYYR
jgi:hypothetical protein